MQLEAERDFCEKINAQEDSGEEKSRLNLAKL
jgi:hypothetical protein